MKGFPIPSQWTWAVRSDEYEDEVMTLDRSEADVLCERVAEKFNPEEIVDILGLSSEELVEELRGYIIDNAERFDTYLEDE